MARTETQAAGADVPERDRPVLEPLTEAALDWALDFARRSVRQVGPGIPLSKKAMARAFAQTEERMRRNFKTRD